MSHSHSMRTCGTLGSDCSIPRRVACPSGSGESRGGHGGGREMVGEWWSGVGIGQVDSRTTGRQKREWEARFGPLILRDPNLGRRQLKSEQAHWDCCCPTTGKYMSLPFPSVMQQQSHWLSDTAQPAYSSTSLDCAFNAQMSFLSFKVNHIIVNISHRLQS